ncbi:MAG: hypothetical protein HFH41_02250 [Lachnospiraceae bacterium]|nr:hypothetical protein [Lachnospiraceae bacterium]
MNRSHSTIYRICLLAVVILTITGGIFYYVNYVANQNTITEGTLVRAWSLEEGLQRAEEENASEETSVESFRPYAGKMECA